MHLVRLMRMGVEALRDGELLADREAVDELYYSLATSDSAWSRAAPPGG